MKKIFIAAIVCLVFFSCASQGGDDPNATKPDAYQDYTGWVKVNSQTITGDETGVLGKAHAGAAGFREVYANSAGAAGPPYAEGSIIVKDSFKNDGGNKGDLAAVTIMVKRESGYDSDNGDWEYIMLNAKMKNQAQGKLSSCIACHAAAEDMDYIFTGN